MATLSQPLHVANGHRRRRMAGEGGQSFFSQPPFAENQPQCNAIYKHAHLQKKRPGPNDGEAGILQLETKRPDARELVDHFDRGDQERLVDNTRTRKPWNDLV